MFLTSCRSNAHFYILFSYIIVLSGVSFCLRWFFLSLHSLHSLSLFFCSHKWDCLTPSIPSLSPRSTASLLPSLLWPPHSANCYNSIVPSLPVGSDGINKAGFEIDFLSAPFWITLLRGFGSEHSSSCWLWYHDAVYIHRVSILMWDYIASHWRRWSIAVILYLWWSALLTPVAINKEKCSRLRQCSKVRGFFLTNIYPAS